jgi:hypothetical protein
MIARADRLSRWPSNTRSHGNYNYFRAFNPPSGIYGNDDGWIYLCGLEPQMGREAGHPSNAPSSLRENTKTGARLLVRLLARRYPRIESPS